MEGELGEKETSVERIAKMKDLVDAIGKDENAGLSMALKIKEQRDVLDPEIIGSERDVENKQDELMLQKRAYLRSHLKAQEKLAGH